MRTHLSRRSVLAAGAVAPAGGAIGGVMVRTAVIAGPRDALEAEFVALVRQMTPAMRLAVPGLLVDLIDGVPRGETERLFWLDVQGIAACEPRRSPAPAEAPALPAPPRVRRT